MPTCKLHNKQFPSYVAYDKLVSTFGLRAVMDVCPCNADWSLKDPVHLRVLNNVVENKCEKLFSVSGDDIVIHLPEKKLKKKESEGRWFFVTFTRDDQSDDPAALLKRTEKLIKSKMVSASQWCYSLELTEKGIPHTHIRFESSKYFDYAKIKALNGGYRADVQPERYGSAKYVVKDESKPTKEYLDKYGLEGWFFRSDNYTGILPNSEFDAKIISWA